VSWDNGNTAASRLIDWLDPLSTGTLVLDGYPDGFELPNLDAQSGGISGIAENNCSDQVSPVFTLVNHGTTTLVSCTINYQLNNGSTSTIDWTGSLNTNQTDAIELPTLTANNGANSLTVWITNVNGAANDDVANNNSSTFTFNAISGNASSFSINLVLDDYPEETSWEILDDNNNIVASGTGYAGGTVNLDVCVAAGCYEFTIIDEYGDGICCAWGEGSYEVVNPNGVVVASGGEFADSETTTICTNTVGLANANEAIIAVYPNPSDEYLRVQSNGAVTELRLFDSVGRMIQRTFNQTTLSTNQIAEGMYTLTVITTQGTFNRQVLVKH
jgi:hypothetical protein